MGDRQQRMKGRQSGGVRANTRESVTAATAESDREKRGGEPRHTRLSSRDVDMPAACTLLYARQKERESA